MLQTRLGLTGRHDSPFPQTRKKRRLLLKRHSKNRFNQQRNGHIEAQPGGVFVSVSMENNTLHDLVAKASTSAVPWHCETL